MKTFLLKILPKNIIKTINSQAMLNIQYNAEEKSLTLTFEGRMDTIASLKISEILTTHPLVQAIQPEDRIVFDLAGVDFIASSFIRICISQAKQVGSSRFSIANCQPFIKKTLKISGLDDLLNVSLFPG